MTDDCSLKLMYLNPVGTPDYHRADAAVLHHDSDFDVLARHSALRIDSSG